MQNQNQQGNQDDDGNGQAAQQDDRDWPGAYILERSSTVLLKELDRYLEWAANDNSRCQPLAANDNSRCQPLAALRAQFVAAHAQYALNPASGESDAWRDIVRSTRDRMEIIYYRL